MAITNITAPIMSSINVSPLGPGAQRGA